MVERINPKDLRVRHINERVEIDGIIEFMGEIEIRVRSVKFECPSCGTIISVMQRNNKIKGPLRCSCGRKRDFRMISKEMIDFQKVHLKDINKKIGVSLGLNVIFMEDLPPKNETIKEGDKVRVLGEIREKPVLDEKKISIVSEYYMVAEKISLI